MLDMISEAVPLTFTLQNLIFINIGMLVGIIFGAIPGLNGNLAITVLLPFTFSFDTVPALLMLTSIFFGANFGGSISAILIGCLIAQIFIFLQGKYLMRFFVKATHIPYDLLTAVLVAVCATGAFAVNGKLIDVQVMVIAGVGAYLLKKFDYPVVPLVLGMVLGSTAEENLRSTMTVINGSWLNFFQRPVCLALTIILALIIGTTVHGNRRHRKQKAAQ